MKNDLPSVWHNGERTLQERAGSAARMEAAGRHIIRPFMPEQHSTFYAQLPFMLLAAVDPAGDPWVTLVEAEHGVARALDATHLRLHALPKEGDPAREGIVDGAAVGMLGIELPTRRRNRVNGTLAQVGPGGFTLQVGESFGNCPQYIQLRQPAFVRDPARAYAGAIESLAGLDDDARAMIAGADTFFVGSYADVDGARRVDVSHRGGKAGFVRVDGDVLTIPDFAGNLFFNTLGNVLLNGRAGMLFVDFANGDVLQLVGRAEVVLDGAEIDTFQGAERLWRLRVEKVVRRRGLTALRSDLNGVSPNVLMTGSWEDAAARAAASSLGDVWRRMRVVRIVDESSTIKSFHLEPVDGAGLHVFKAGQHLPIRLTIVPGGAPVIRTYTLSMAPSDGAYRISVKREGAVSHFLHAGVRVGDEIEARAPQGGFVVDPFERRPLVLLGAGIGITPLLAMLREVVYEGLRKRRVRPVYVVYAARNRAERAFEAELRKLKLRGGEAVQLLRVLSQPGEGDVAGRDFDHHGRIDIDLLKSLLPFDDFDFYVCGPSAFTQDLYDGLRALQVADARIHAEQFGPSALVRSAALAEAAKVAQPAVATTAVPLVFARSLKEARWTPGDGTLLEVAEARGLAPEYSCRSGSCGSCRTRLLEGEVSYATPPSAPLADGEVLPCCAMPAAQSGRIVLDL
jgi:ferredoxin-NADP reductase/predicted pyridoxine 5'-phosphate oxidase superfamily flavin-nucleotide-binding protein